MGVRGWTAGAWIAALMAALTAVASADTPAPGASTDAAGTADARRGARLGYTCLGCHGIEGYRNAYPDYRVPKLEGQNAEYLVTALHGYRDGDRSHLTMHDQASTLSDQDISDVAAYFAGKPLSSGGKAPGEVPQAAALCTTCHGQDGVAIAPIYPSLAGQHGDYLRRAIEEYQKGGRKNPVMTGFASTLSSADVAVITAYFSHLSPALRTKERPTRLQAQAN